MHGNRRRKKRPNYGVRTVDITKGKIGFGFTINGQAPCKFSFIVAGSPAERAGLRHGDYLIAVNGQNVSKAQHNEVVRLIGLSKTLKLQIAENYYSDSSDDEFVSVTRTKPKYSTRFRKPLRGEKISREFQNCIGSNPNAQFEEVAVISDQDWNEGYTSKVLQEKSIKQIAGGVSNSRSLLCASPARLRPDQICMLVAEAQQLKANHILNENSEHPPRLRHSPRKPLKSQSLVKSPNHQVNSEMKENQHNLYHYPHITNRHHISNDLEPYNGITEQEINNILYPTLAELQHQLPSHNLGESFYRSVVGYLGTIEMPKEAQGGSRLTGIRNCIRRLRIEKKVHTLVLMSIFTEQVVLTNPHGLTLAQYPAERITFCGVYADDKKFFGLVTVHGSSSDEVSDTSQDEGGSDVKTLSSSCHVFMVDPKMVQHADHARRAKTFRIECRQAQDDSCGQCQEFPESADPILHAIMSLYRNRVGFNLETGAPGLIDVDAQMSPQHSNTSSNSSNSDSGIGFRDDVGHSYPHGDGVFVVDVEDNQRLRIQNFAVNRSNICDNFRANMDNLRANIDNLRANLNISLNHNNNNNNNINNNNNNITGRNENVSRCNTPKGIKSNSNSIERKSSARTNISAKNLDKNCMNCISDDNQVSLFENDSDDFRVGNDNLRVSVSDTKLLNEIRSSLAEGRLSLVDGRTSVSDELKQSLSHNFFSESRSNVVSPDRMPPEVPPRVELTLNKSPTVECVSPPPGDRFNVRAMPDPISFERLPGFLKDDDTPVHVASMTYSMRKYLQHKQEHLVKISQKINRRESDSGTVHPLSVRAFSPATHGRETPIIECVGSRNPISLELSSRLSPKVYDLSAQATFPILHSRAPSERSYTRSLEDLRDSSTSDGVVGSLGIGGGSGSFRDGSESDYYLDRVKHGLGPMNWRNLHASETNLSRYGDPSCHRGAFRAVAPKAKRMLSSFLDTGPLSSARYMALLDSDDYYFENTGDKEGSSQDVHPPTQDEFSQESDFEQGELTNAGGKKWGRGPFPFRQRFIRNRHDEPDERLVSKTEPPAHSDTEINKDSVSRELSRVACWALSFEKLLEDPAGLHTFVEFLKKEYSHENIYFWASCERYKRISDPVERQLAARDICKRHLDNGGPEPVNVDSEARQMAQEGLTSNPELSIFDLAQKQIYNLMKFDSYPRFLKSDLYRQCSTSSASNLPFIGDETMEPELRVLFDDGCSKLKKSKSDADERRRRSLLPWSSKVRSKSKDRGESDYRRQRKLGQRLPSSSSSTRSEVSGSRTSLNSSESALLRRHGSRDSITSGDTVSLSGSEGMPRCRVILPDGSTSVADIRSDETVHNFLLRVLEKRRLSFSCFALYNLKQESIDLSKDSSILKDMEVRLEQRAYFYLNVQEQHKRICLKAKIHKLLGEVLKPVFREYGIKAENVSLFIKNGSNMSAADLRSSVKNYDTKELVIISRVVKGDYSETGSLKKSTYKIERDNPSPSVNFHVLDLEESSNKNDSDNSSSASYGGWKNSTIELDKKHKKSTLTKNTHQDLTKSDSNQEKESTEKFCDIIGRGHNDRLDDQRGTKLNCKLPDFLKCDQEEDKENKFYSQLESRLSDGGVLPTSQEAESYFRQVHQEAWEDVIGRGSFSPETTLMAQDFDDLDNTLCAEDSLCHIPQPDASSSSLHLDPPNFTPPPPLPIVDSSAKLPSSLSCIGLPPPYLTPPPPLPPKPKITMNRGPPPRPPSRQLLSGTSYLPGSESDVISRRNPDKFSISFV